MQHIYDVIIIGGGPAGIGAAVETSIMGVEKVLVIEKGDNHSQTIRRFYKDNKRVDKDYKGQVIDLEGHIDFIDGSKESTLDYFDQLLDDEHIDVAFNSEVESVELGSDGLFRVTTAREGFIARLVIVAIGRMGRPNRPDYKIPVSIADRVNFNLDKCSQGENILVVGGGNSAAEYAIGLTSGNTVTLNYRKKTFTRLNDINLRMVTDYESQGALSMLLGIDVVGLEGESGKVKVLFADGSTRAYDRVIYAIGGTTPVEFLRKCGITMDGEGYAIVDEHLQTAVPNLYICGDITTRSGGSIALALNQAHEIISHAFGRCVLEAKKQV
jgi:thioredoxin reductase (NADPH)